MRISHNFLPVIQYDRLLYHDTISGEASTHFCVSTFQRTSIVSDREDVTCNVWYNLGSITLLNEIIR